MATSAVLHLLFVFVVLTSFWLTEAKIDLTTPEILILTLGKSSQFKFTLRGIEDVNIISNIDFNLNSMNKEIVRVGEVSLSSSNLYHATGFFSLTGNQIGETQISLAVLHNGRIEDESFMYATVIHKEGLTEIVFVYLRLLLVVLFYFNLGCILDWYELKISLKKPIGPVIAFLGQFIIMPPLCYGFGRLLYEDDPEYHLSLLYMGMSPGGGASNIWTYLLDGNLALSVIVTGINTTGAFAMLPLWIYTLGSVTYYKNSLGIPYIQITIYMARLFIPLAIGYLVQKVSPKLAKIFVKMFKLFAYLMVLFMYIAVFAINKTLLKELELFMFISGVFLPWIGYVLPFLLAKLCRQSFRDSMTVAIEIGMLNTGIAIALIRMAIPLPKADMISATLLCAEIMAPIPLLCLLIGFKIKLWCWSDNKVISTT